MPAPGDLFFVTIAPTQTKVGRREDILRHVHKIDLQVKDGLYRFVCGATGGGHAPTPDEVEFYPRCPSCKIPSKEPS